MAHRRAQGQAPEAAFVETCGGIVGGVIGGSLPDILEPATSPRHRGMGHSILAGLGVAYATLEDARSYCRSQAEEYRALKGRPGVTEGERLWYALVEMFWRFIAGLFSGLQAGYGSHLALDAFTPAGLPLLA